VAHPTTNKRGKLLGAMLDIRSYVIHSCQAACEK
jgi:hypothetical protein